MRETPQPSGSAKGTMDGLQAAEGRAEATPTREAGDGDPPSWSIKRLFSRALATLASDGAEDVADPDARGDERELLGNVVRMRGQRVADVMIPRADIVAASETASLDEIVAVFRAGQFTRLPIYRETLDEPVGFLHFKDIAFAYGFGRGGAPFDLARHLRQPLYVPPSMSSAALLQKMRASRQHMALVIDEFGGLDGLVTIEDLIEEIVGEIEDEHDDAEAPLWRAEGERVWLVEARTPIAAFEAAAGVPLAVDGAIDEVDTVGGLVFSLAERVPEPGETITHPDGHRFHVIEADPRLIRRLRVTLADQAVAA
jgi:magnesium and cobalt transporter